MSQQLEAAKKAHQEGKFDIMSSNMLQYAQQNPRLNAEERNILFIAFKGAASKCRGDLKQNANNQNAAHELETCCAQFINLLAQTLIPAAVDSEAQVFLHKAMGDFYRYYDEVKPSQQNKTSALQCYENASQIAAGGLDATNPLRLNVALNHGVCLTEQLNDKQKGLSITEAAIDSARTGLTKLDEQKKIETSFVLQLLLDNAKLWRQELNMPEPKPIEGLTLPQPQQGQQGQQNAPQMQQQKFQQQQQFAQGGHPGFAQQQQWGQR